MKKLIFIGVLATATMANAGQWLIQDLLNGIALSLTNSQTLTWSNKGTLYCTRDGTWVQSYTSNYYNFTNTTWTAAAPKTYGMTAFPYWTNSVKTANANNNLAGNAFVDVSLFPNVNGEPNTNACIYMAWSPQGYETGGTNTIELDFVPVPDGETTETWQGSKKFTQLPLVLYFDYLGGTTNASVCQPIVRGGQLTNFVNTFTGSMKMRLWSIAASSDAAANGITNMIITKLKYIQWVP